VRPAYEKLRDELLSDLKKAMPVDMVVLALHGAMAAQGYDDCEGDILQRIRAIVGDKVPVGGELDLHCHITDTMVRERRFSWPIRNIPTPISRPGRRALHLRRRCRRGQDAAGDGGL